MTTAPVNPLTQGESAQGYLADPRNDGVLVYVNGDFVPRNEARVSIFDSGFVLGDGIWEGLRLVRGKIISLDAHLDRLWEGATSIALDIGMSRAELTQALDETLARVAQADDLVPADLMIEAVVEDSAVKEDIFRRADDVLPAESVLASNTSSIPITSLAAVTGRPDRVASSAAWFWMILTVPVPTVPRPTMPRRSGEASCPLFWAVM